MCLDLHSSKGVYSQMHIKSCNLTLLRYYLFLRCFGNHKDIQENIIIPKIDFAQIQLYNYASKIKNMKYSNSYINYLGFVILKIGVLLLPDF